MPLALDSGGSAGCCARFTILQWHLITHILNCRLLCCTNGQEIEKGNCSSQSVLSHAHVSAPAYQEAKATCASGNDPLSHLVYGECSVGYKEHGKARVFARWCFSVKGNLFIVSRHLCPPLRVAARTRRYEHRLSSYIVEIHQPHVTDEEWL